MSVQAECDGSSGNDASGGDSSLFLCSCASKQAIVRSGPLVELDVGSSSDGSSDHVDTDSDHGTSMTGGAVHSINTGHTSHKPISSALRWAAAIRRDTGQMGLDCGRRRLHGQFGLLSLGLKM